MTTAAPPDASDDRELGIDEAVRTIAALAPQLTGQEHVALAQARLRVLAQAVHARADLPGFDNAAMDGYALRHAEASQPLREIGRRARRPSL